MWIRGRYPQVLLTPHIGSLTVECRRRMEMEAVENLLDALERAGDGTFRRVPDGPAKP